MQMSVDQGSFGAGELAKRAGVSTDTLRHYERKGVLTQPPRSANGYRQYSPSALDRVQLVRRALGVGFTLDELAKVLRIRDQGGAPCAKVRALAAAKLSEVETRLRDLTELRNELRTVLKDWDQRLSQSGHGERAHLLESLGAGNQREAWNHRRVSEVHLTRREKKGSSK
jgi:MerR family transcriptional regulator, Zn(II)-responsive regulator of zntA